MWHLHEGDCLEIMAEIEDGSIVMSNRKWFRLDNCAGSGTTGVAAELCGRNSILVERDESYCAAIQQRLIRAVLEVWMSG